MTTVYLATQDNTKLCCSWLQWKCYNIWLTWVLGLWVQEHTIPGETSNSASVTNRDPGGVVASCEVVGSHKPDTGADKVDGVGIPRTQSDPATYSLVKRVGSLNNKKQTPSTGVQPTHMHLSAGSVDNVGSELQSSTESSSSYDKHGSGNDEGGEQGSEELDSMLTILNATLLLAPPEEPRETTPTPPREAFRAGAWTQLCMHHCSWHRFSGLCTVTL